MIFNAIIGGVIGACLYHLFKYLYNGGKLFIFKKKVADISKIDKVFISPGVAIDSITTSFEYNRRDDHVIRLLMNVLSRAKGEDRIPFNANQFEDVREDADIFNGFLVLAYGDYGTSPRYGWLDSECKDVIIKALEEELKDCIDNAETNLEFERHKYDKDEIIALEQLVTLWHSQYDNKGEENNDENN